MKYLIIGNCAAGVNAVESIRKVDLKGEITVISDEAGPAYCRCLITDYLAGTHSEKEITLRGKEFYEKNKVNLILGKEAKRVEPKTNKVILGNGKEINYDKLLIATGASPKPLRVEGEDKIGVSGFRTLQDARKLKGLLKEARKALVFGGGLIGLKAGYALHKAKVDVEIIVKSPRILSQVLDEGASQIIAKWLIKNGIKIQTGLGPTKILGKEKAEGVLLDNDKEIDCQIVIAGKGVAANMSLVRDTEIKTNWGILANKFLQTNVENIYAAGDVVETMNLVTGKWETNALWTAATEQGRIAGLNMAGESKRYPGALSCNAVDFFALPTISVGYVRVREEGYEEIIRSEPEEYIYKKIILADNRLVGVVLVGKIDNAGVYTGLIRRKVDVASVRDILLEDYFDYGDVQELLEKEEGFRETISLEGDLLRMA